MCVHNVVRLKVAMSPKVAMLERPEFCMPRILHCTKSRNQTNFACSSQVLLDQRTDVARIVGRPRRFRRLRTIDASARIALDSTRQDLRRIPRSENSRRSSRSVCHQSVYDCVGLSFKLVYRLLLETKKFIKINGGHVCLLVQVV